MAKVRKMTIGRSDRFLGGYNYGQGQSTVDDSAPEFSEDDVWSVVGDWAERASAQRRVKKEGGLSSAFNDASKTASSKIAQQLRPRGRQVAGSAPLSVPDWSKIYRVGSVESMQDSDDWASDFDSEMMVPPHEYLARKMAANSVVEGVGRTLKGRDMSRVRDAVWSQTGFDG